MNQPIRTRCVLGLVLLLPFAAGAAHAAAPPGGDGVVTVRIENDALNGTDRYYTAGQFLGWTGPVGEVPDPIARLGHWLWGPGQQQIGLGLTQLLFTPRNTQIDPPNPADRPYAGLLLGGVSLIQHTSTRQDVLSLDLGVIGPAALGEQAQNGFHRLIGDTTDKGWDDQLPDQPVIELTVQRTWRISLPLPGPLQMDLLPEVTAAAGTWRVYGQAGAILRFGQGLDRDFGAARNQPGLSGGDAYVTTGHFAWYVFVGGDGQAVAWDETLQGEPFRSTAHVTPDPLVGEAEAGIAVMIGAVRASFTHVVQTASFRGQTSGLFQFDSVSVSIPF